MAMLNQELVYIILFSMFLCGYFLYFLKIINCTQRVINNCNYWEALSVFRSCSCCPLYLLRSPEVSGLCKRMLLPSGLMCKLITFTRWVQLNDLNFNIVYWSVEDKFIDILNQCQCCYFS